MADNTENFGLERLLPGEGLSRAFLYENITIIDRLLELGAISHRHNGALALADPATIPTVVLDEDGGSIAADLSLYIGYTWIDARAGETALSEPELVTTPGGLPAPSLAPELVEIDTTAGTLLPQTYRYALTVVGDNGGESMLGPPITVVVNPGSSTNSISLTGLLDAADEVGATTWRLWRSVGGGAWGMVNQGTTNDLLDDGSFCIDCDVSPPTSANSAATNLLRVTVPAPAPDDAVGLNIYASLDGSFDSPALLVNLPIDQVGVEQIFTTLELSDGRPPDINMSLGGAAKIDPDTELVDFPWKRPVALVADLPAAGNTTGDIRAVQATGRLYRWDGDSWEQISSGHVIEDESVALTTRGKLDFRGVNVAVTDDAANDRTVVTVSGGGGGGTVLDVEDEIQWLEAGNPVAALRATRVGFSNGQEGSDWMEETFDGAAGFVGAFQQRDGTGHMVPDASGNNREAHLQTGLGGSEHVYLSRQYEILSNNWHRTGVCVGRWNVATTGVIGFYGYIDRDAGELQVRVKRTSDGDGQTGGIPNDEDNYEIIATWGATDGYTPPAIGDIGTIEISRAEGLITVVEQRRTDPGDPDTLVTAGQLADIPVPTDMLEGLFGPRVYLQGFLADWWSNPDAWQSDGYYEELTSTLLQLQFGFGDGVNPMNWWMFAEQYGTGEEVRLSNLAVDLDAAWSAGTEAPSVSRLKDNRLALYGRVEKTAGTAPVDGEVIGTLPPALSPGTNRLLQVVTGDDDGVELGIIEIVGGSDPTTPGELRWRDGRSTDPATKTPYVAFDGLDFSS